MFVYSQALKGLMKMFYTSEKECLMQIFIQDITLLTLKNWIRCQQACAQWIHEKGCHGRNVCWVFPELMWQCGGDRPHMEVQGCGRPPR